MSKGEFQPAPGVAFYLQLIFWMDCCCVGTDVRVLAEMQDRVKLLLFGFKSHLHASQLDQTKKTVGGKGEFKIINCAVQFISRAGTRGDRALLSPDRNMFIMD